jgi:hypothetical protein
LAFSSLLLSCFCEWFGCQGRLPIKTLKVRIIQRLSRHGEANNRMRGIEVYLEIHLTPPSVKMRGIRRRLKNIKK